MHSLNAVDDVDVSRPAGPGYWLGLGAALTYARFLLNGVPETASYYADVYGDFVRVWIGGVPTYLTTRCVCACVFCENAALDHLNSVRDRLIFKNSAETETENHNICRMYHVCIGHNRHAQRICGSSRGGRRSNLPFSVSHSASPRGATE